MNNLNKVFKIVVIPLINDSITTKEEINNKLSNGYILLGITKSDIHDSVLNYHLGKISN